MTLADREGYGPIDVGEPPEPFHAPWEARMLGIVRAFTRPRNWSIDWFRHVRECIGPADYLTRPYYDQWLQTYAAMMIDSGVATLDELATGKSARDIPGHAAADDPGEGRDREDGDGSFRPRIRMPSLPSARATRWSPANSGARGHTRLPQYARGRPGRVEVFHGFHVLPDTNMAGNGPAEPLYTVAFRAADLWPEAEGRKDRVYLDLWESYLERA